MTAEEQKTYDEAVSKAREVADAVKQHRHDESVFAFAPELSDNVIGPMDGGDLSSSGSGSKSRRLSFKGMSVKIATQMLGPDGTKALASLWCHRGRAGVRRRPCRLGPGRAVAQSLLDVLPTKQHTSAEYAYLAQPTRMNAAGCRGSTTC